MDVGLSLKSCHPAALQSDGPKDPHQQIYGAAACAHIHTHTKFPAVVHPTVFQISQRLLLSSHFPCLQMLPAILGRASYYCVFVNAARVLGCRRESHFWNLVSVNVCVCVGRARIPTDEARTQLSIPSFMRVCPGPA